MKSKLFRRLFLGLLIFLIAWLVFAQFIMKSRISDKIANEKFLKEGVVLHTDFFKTDGFKIHYAKTGNDTFPSLFFVHGSPDSWTRYEEYMKDKDLLARYRMISIDRPGFGYSQFGDAKNLKDQSKLISPFIRSIQNGKPIYAVGHSYGGAMVVKLQTDNIDLFDGLILLAAAVDPKEEKPERWRYMMNIPPLKYLLPGAYRPSNTELVYLKEDLKELDKEWEKISCPVWILHGDKDTYVPVANADYAEKKLTKAKSVEVKILPGADHFIPKERYEEVKEVLMNLPV
ncbi:MAG TPA: alpha/beta hydrolase [Chitinophagaceae bacterium]